jgi:hypothetical protein
MLKKRIAKPTRLGDAVRLVARLGGYIGRAADPPQATKSCARAIRNCRPSAGASLKAQHEDAERAAREKLQRLRQLMATRDAAGGQPIRAAGPSAATPRRHIGPSPEAIARYEAEAKVDVRARWGVDPNAPGWRGLVLQRIAEIARQRDDASGRT